MIFKHIWIITRKEMDTMLYLLSTISSVLLAIVVFFLKLIISDFRKLKDAQIETKQDVVLLQTNLKTAEDTIDRHHGKIGAQTVKSNEMQTSFLLMRKDIKQILERLPQTE